MNGYVKETKDRKILVGRLHTLPRIDKTLEKDGMAADARVTGEKIAQLGEQISKMASAKPSGRYTGDGGSGERTVSIGGSGQMLCIIGGEHTLFVSIHGAIVLDSIHGSVTSLSNYEASFSGGVLRIRGYSDALNASGVVYAYQVI